MQKYYCMQVWLLNIGHSAISSNAAAQVEEVEQLMRLFRDSVDSAASGEFCQSLHLTCMLGAEGLATLSKIWL
jgi:hypothetical protein